MDQAEGHLQEVASSPAEALQEKESDAPAFNSPNDVFRGIPAAGKATFTMPYLPQ